MKLYTSLTSPYGRKVRVVCHEKRIDLQIIEATAATPDSPVNSLNPLGKVPVLVLDDNRALYDSSVIVDFLDHISPVGRMIPAEFREATHVKRWEALAGGLVDATVIIVQESRRPAAMQMPAVVAHQEAKLQRGLAQIAADLGDTRWCTGENFNLADVAVGCLLGYLDLRLGTLDWRAAWPELAALQARLDDRPSFIDTLK